MSYSKPTRYLVLLTVLFVATGCASQSNEAKLQSDLVILTQKMQALTVELKVLKEKQLKEQQLKAQQQMKAAKAEAEKEKRS
ncbi:hypothetical protein [Tolumonas osonensis]|uniref:Membrane protein insertase Oxa1/YidC/SpoIIIJ n=1 Tax=Tolumonas osonensis TaxID=675874 RepID=A0A841GK04_9GAMM|nr:hypothetical protein [Tolumonas osonensis]MBB6055531.1 membrane protein insertase Oxa1/YidC/SpoIIIJ [Tolumonas osonensis]